MERINDARLNMHPAGQNNRGALENAMEKEFIATITHFDAIFNLLFNYINLGGISVARN